MVSNIEKYNATKKAKAKKEALKPYPFSDSGATENAAVRMVKMVIPNCPADSRPEIQLRDGRSIANPRYTGEPNCQQAYKINNQGKWDVEKCESLGHDPWRTTFRKTVVEDVVDERETLEDGTPNPNFGYVVEQRERIKVEHRLNVIQVSENNRHGSGMGVQLALARGCRFLEDFGIESPCEYRSCTRPKKISTRYGQFCGERHARLVGADKRKVMLLIGGDPMTDEQAYDEREEQLQNIPLSAEDM